MATSNARFTTIVSGTCEWSHCHRGDAEGLWVAIVTGDYGQDGLASYCDEHASMLADSDKHTFVGQAECISDAEVDG